MANPGGPGAKRTPSPRSITDLQSWARDLAEAVRYVGRERRRDADTASAVDHLMTRAVSVTGHLAKTYRPERFHCHARLVGLRPRTLIHVSDLR